MSKNAACILVLLDAALAHRCCLRLRSHRCTSPGSICISELLHARVVLVHVDVVCVHDAILLVEILALAFVLGPDFTHVTLTLLGHDFCSGGRGLNQVMRALILENIFTVTTHSHCGTFLRSARIDDVVLHLMGSHRRSSLDRAGGRHRSHLSLLLMIVDIVDVKTALVTMHDSEGRVVHVLHYVFLWKFELIYDKSQSFN